EVPPLREHARLARRKSGVTRIQESRRRVHELLAPNSRTEVVRAPDGRSEEARVPHLLPEVRLPAKARVHCHAVSDAPGVLAVQPQVGLGRVCAAWPANL